MSPVWMPSSRMLTELQHDSAQEHSASPPTMPRAALGEDVGLALVRWLIDGMNVIGTRPDAWWKDRHAAMVRLVHMLESWVAVTGEDVTVVFEQPPRPPITSTVIEVAHAPRPRRDSADDEIVRRLAAEPRARRGPRRHLRRLARRSRARGRRHRRAGRRLPGATRGAADGARHPIRPQRRGEHRLPGRRRGRTRPAVRDRLDHADRASVGGAGQPPLPRAPRGLRPADPVRQPRDRAVRARA